MIRVIPGLAVTSIATLDDGEHAVEVIQAAERGFLPGDHVEVHSFGRWYPTGEVVSVGRVNVRVRYTPGRGKPREKTFSPDRVRRKVPCDGEAHRNAFIDNCARCAPDWGWMPAPAEVAS